MIAALQQEDETLITNLAFLGKEPWNYDTENLPANGYSRVVVLQPLIKMLGPTAMADPTHAEFQRIVQNAGSTADVRKAAIKEIRRRMDVLKG
ncbi:hypothetical protein [Yoonia sp. 2307UL14-13]|uniref:hypothetical protein n=1 Tax=Yoonia sp. 2307UL14-13 TaxID=3126506 RepID=UPI003098EBEF